MARRLFNLVTLLSIFGLLLTAVMWARSCWYLDSVEYVGPQAQYEISSRQGITVLSSKIEGGPWATILGWRGESRRLAPSETFVTGYRRWSLPGIEAQSWHGGFRDGAGPWYSLDDYYLLISYWVFFVASLVFPSFWAGRRWRRKKHRGFPVEKSSPAATADSTAP